MAFLDPIFNTLFGFMLNWPPVYGILILSFLISLLIVVIYKLMTNQTEMKQLKDELKEYQNKMKKLKDKPEELMKVQKQAMSVNMRYMKQSMKPTFITFIPIILIFGWMQGVYAFEPLMPGQEFALHVAMEKDVTGNVTITTPNGLEIIGDSTAEITDSKAIFKLKGEEGEYYATLESQGEKQDKQIIITKEKKYAPVTERYKSDVFKSATLDNKPLKVLWGLKWIWVYIIFAIVFSMVLRKLLKIY